MAEWSTLTDGTRDQYGPASVLQHNHRHASAIPLHTHSNDVDNLLEDAAPDVLLDAMDVPAIATIDTSKRRHWDSDGCTF